MDLLVEISIIAVAYAIFSVVLQRKLVNMKAVYQNQETMKAKLKEFNELVKSKADQATLSAKQREISVLTAESMKSQLKPVLVLLPIFLVMYYVAFPAIFPSTATVVFLSNKMGYQSYFILTTFVIGLVLSSGMMIYERSKLKKAQAMQVGSGASQEPS